LVTKQFMNKYKNWCFSSHKSEYTTSNNREKKRKRLDSTKEITKYPQVQHNIEQNILLSRKPWVCPIKECNSTFTESTVEKFYFMPSLLMDYLLDRQKPIERIDNLNLYLTFH